MHHEHFARPDIHHMGSCNVARARYVLAMPMMSQHTALRGAQVRLAQSAMCKSAHALCALQAPHTGHVTALPDIGCRCFHQLNASCALVPARAMSSSARCAQELLYRQVWHALGPNVKTADGEDMELPAKARCRGRSPIQNFARKDWQCGFLLSPQTLTANEAALRDRCPIGFVNLAFEHPVWSVALVSCMGNWRGCIPSNAPALVYHHGTNDERILAYRPRVQAALRLWVISYGDAWLTRVHR